MSSLRNFVWIILPASLLVYEAACSEATDGLVPPDAGAGFESGLGTSSGGSSSGGSSTSSSGGQGLEDAAASSSSPILINEISGDDWIELFNSGSTAIDIGGWKVADFDSDTNGPKLDEAVTLPNGTSLGPGEYGMIQGGGIDGGDPCPAGGQTFCERAEFGISKGGDRVFLIDKDGNTVGSSVFPALDAGGPDLTWGRIPSGDPEAPFSETTPTPGAENQSP